MKIKTLSILIIAVILCSCQESYEPIFKSDLSNAIDAKGVWHYEGDVLTASEDACIFTDIEYEDFVVDLDFKNEKGTNSGVIVYCTDRENWMPNSVEVQICDDYYFKEKKRWGSNVLCGAIFGHLGPKKIYVKRSGEWNHMNIRCEGQHIVVEVNGEVSADMDMSLWTSAKNNPNGSRIPSWLSTPFAELPTKGYIGFQGKHGEANIYFRDIKIAKL